MEPVCSAGEVGACLLQDPVEVPADLVVPLLEVGEIHCVVEVADRLTEGFESFVDLPARAQDAQLTDGCASG